MLKLTDFTKSYHGTIAVDSLSLEVKPGDIYGFIGHNGAGKTTTIRAIVGILAFEGGTITIDGHDVKKEPMACKSITAYIPDTPELYPYLTGIQYLNFIADIYGVDASVRRERIERYTKAFEIEGRLGDPISSYSHGMKQKLSICSAFLHEPRLLVLDEPFVGLDPKASFTLKEMMHEFCRGGGAIFFSSHVLEVVEKLCNKIAIIKAGKLLVSGQTDEVRGNDTLEDVFLELTDHA